MNLRTTCSVCAANRLYKLLIFNQDDIDLLIDALESRKRHFQGQIKRYNNGVSYSSVSDETDILKFQDQVSHIDRVLSIISENWD